MIHLRYLEISVFTCCFYSLLSTASVNSMPRPQMRVTLALAIGALSTVSGSVACNWYDTAAVGEQCRSFGLNPVYGTCTTANMAAWTAADTRCNNNTVATCPKATCIVVTDTVPSMCTSYNCEFEACQMVMGPGMNQTMFDNICAVAVVSNATAEACIDATRTITTMVTIAEKAYNEMHRVCPTPKTSDGYAVQTSLMLVSYSCV